MQTLLPRVVEGTSRCPPARLRRLHPETETSLLFSPNRPLRLLSDFDLEHLVAAAVRPRRIGLLRERRVFPTQQRPVHPFEKRVRLDLLRAPSRPQPLARIASQQLREQILQLRARRRVRREAERLRDDVLKRRSIRAMISGWS